MKKAEDAHITFYYEGNELEKAEDECRMVNLNLRQAIVQRVHGKSEDELFDVVEGSIDGDERALPGLGVLFEIIWQHSEKATQDTLISTLKSHI